MKLKVNKVNLTAKSVGITLKAFDPGRNRSLNNDFDSIKLRKNFVQKDKSLSNAVKSVPKTQTSQDIILRVRDNEPMHLRVIDTGKPKWDAGHKPITNYTLNPSGYAVDMTRRWWNVNHSWDGEYLFSDDIYVSSWDDHGDYWD